MKTILRWIVILANIAVIIAVAVMCTLEPPSGIAILWITLLGFLFPALNVAAVWVGFKGKGWHAVLTLTAAVVLAVVVVSTTRESDEDRAIKLVRYSTSLLPDESSYRTTEKIIQDELSETGGTLNIKGWAAVKVGDGHYSVSFCYEDLEHERCAKFDVHLDPLVLRRVLPRDELSDEARGIMRDSLPNAEERRDSAWAALNKHVSGWRGKVAEFVIFRIAGPSTLELPPQLTDTGNAEN